MSNSTQPRKPGSVLLGIALVLTLITVLLLIVGSNTTDGYGRHTGPTIGAFVPLVIAAVFAILGFAQRLLAAIENRK